MEPTFLNDCEDLQTEFENSELKLELRGMSFDLDAIEMLAPGGATPQPTLPGIQRDGHPRNRAARGRTAKWDWEGAIAHIAAVANTPDGLPTGHGAQAKIARLLSDWFAQAEGESPADSELRLRAANVMTALDNCRK
jgi:hypothetical protein